MNKLKKAIVALGLAATTYMGSPSEVSADQTEVCQLSGPTSTPYIPRLRRGDIFVQRGPDQTYAGAVRERFRNRELSNVAVERIVAEGLRNTQRNYHLDPCFNDALIIPAYTFNRPRTNNGNSGYSLTQEDRTRINESYDRIRLTEEGMRRVEEEVRDLETQVNQVGQDLNEFRNEMADDNSAIMNKLSNRIVDRIEVNTTKTIRDRELRDRRQREAERLRNLERNRSNLVSLGYSWMGENVNGKPYAAGQTLNAELYGTRDITNQWAAFLQADGRLDFLQELDSERNIRAIDLNAEAGLRRDLTENLGLELYLSGKNLSAVVFDNAGDARISQYSLGPGMGLRLDTTNVDANLGVAVAAGSNDTTITDSDLLTRLILNAGVSFQPNINRLPIELNARYRLESTNLDNNEDRSSLQHEITAEALYRPNILPGLALGVHVEESLRDSEANSDEATTVGGLVKYRF